MNLGYRKVTEKNHAKTKLSSFYEADATNKASFH